jgi:Tol biopolymer transport system component
VLLVAALGGTAAATPPGENGRIAFTRYTDATRSEGAIFTIGSDGRSERRVTSPPRGFVDQHPDWSPDGARIVFERCLGTRRSPCRVATVRADGGDLRLLTRSCRRPTTRACAEIRGPAFSPDGRRIVFEALWGTDLAKPYGECPVLCGNDQLEHADLLIMDNDGTNVRRIAGLGGWRGDFDRPQFSPDGKRLVVERRNSWRSKPKGGSALFVLNIDGSGLRQITPWKLAAGDGPDWSPDGTRVLFRAPRTGEFRGSNLYTVRPDGTGLRQVTRVGAAVEILSASYAPDGKWIVFARTGLGGLPDLFVVRPDGSGLQQLTRTRAWESAPDWGPR